MTIIRRIPLPGKLPRDFRNQHKRHKEYKRRGPQSGNHHTDNPGTTRINLSSRFDAEAPASSTPLTSPETESPPPSTPPPPPPSSVPPAPPLSTATTSRRGHKRKATDITSGRRCRRRRRKSENRGPPTQEPVATPSPGRPATGETKSRAEK